MGNVKRHPNCNSIPWEQTVQTPAGAPSTLATTAPGPHRARRSLLNREPAGTEIQGGSHSSGEAIPTPLLAQDPSGHGEGRGNRPFKTTGNQCCCKQEINKKFPRLAGKAVRKARIPAGQCPWERCSVSDAKAHFAPSVKDLPASAARFYVTELSFKQEVDSQFLRLHCKLNFSIH